MLNEHTFEAVPPFRANRWKHSPPVAGLEWPFLTLASQTVRDVDAFTLVFPSFYPDIAEAFGSPNEDRG